MRRFRFEQLEVRQLLAAESLNAESLVNDLVIRLQTTWDAGTSVAVSELGAVVAFSGKGPQDDAGVFAKRYDAAGAPLGNAFQVNSTRNETQSSAVVATDAAGRFVVAWAGRGKGDQSGVFFQQFDSQAQPVGGETLVNTTIGGDQDQPAIAMTPDGAFVVAWHGVGEGDVAGIFQRRFDANATPLGSETRVDTSTEGEQAFPTVAIDDQGRLLTSWSSRHQDGGDWGVYGRVFDAEGRPSTGEFAINSTTASSQIRSQAAVGAQNEFIVGWSSFGQDGDGWGVYARRFSADGAPLGDERQIPSEGIGHQRDVSLSSSAEGALLAAWTSGAPDGSGWETFARALTSELEPDGDPIPLNQVVANLDSGHQQFTASAIAPTGTAAVVFSGNGIDDHDGVFLAAVSTGDGVELAAIADQTTTELTALSVTAVASTTSGQGATYSLERAPIGATIDATTGVIGWTPTEEQGPGVYPFTVIAALSAQPTRRAKEVFVVTVDEINQAPILNFIGSRTVAEGAELRINARATDDDLPTQRLIYQLGADAPEGATIDPLTGAFRWTPSEAQGPGEYPVTLIVDDLNARQATDRETITVTVTETNQAPLLSPIGDLSLPGGGTLVVALSAVDPDMPANTITFRGDSLPAGATINQTTGVVRWTPTEAQLGETYSFEVSAVDDGTPPLSSTITFQVAVAVAAENQSPTLEAIVDASIDEGVPFQVTAVATDPDGDTLTYSFEDAPLGASIDSATGEITWTPSEAQGPGQFVFTVKATDTGSPALADLTVFVVTVNEVNTAPIITPIDDVTIDEQVEWTLAVTADDADLPADLLIYSLVESPVGATINGTTGVITWTPTEAQGPGDHAFRVAVSDKVSTTPTTSDFVVTVREVNRAPEFGATPPQSIGQGDELVYVLTVDDPDTPINTLSFAMDGDARGAQIVPGSAPHTAEFRWTPGFDVVPGEYSFAISVNDDGTPLMNDTATLTVTVVSGGNQPPSFVPGNAPTVAQNSGLQTIANWATQISPGPVSDAGQAVEFLVSADHPELFERLPAISPNGTLTFTPQLGAVGVATMTVQLKDDGGVDGGGIDSTAPLTIPITINACEFDASLTGWRVTATGEAASGQGTVLPVDCRAHMVEGNSNIVEMEQSFVIPEGVSELTFRYDALTFDTTAAGGTGDAFEAALVNGAGASLTPTYTNSTAQDAFLRIAEGGNNPLVGAGATVVNGLVTVSVADIAPNTTARLILRLVNGDADNGSAVQIVDVTLPTGVSPTPGISTAKFFVADAASKSIFAYDETNANTAQFASNPQITELSGIAANPAGTVLWTIDSANQTIGVQASDGTNLGTWHAAGVATPSGIVHSGTNLWIVDRELDKGFFFAGATVRRTGEATASLSFSLDAANGSPTDVATDGAKLWVVDDASDRVFIYSLSGALQDSWTLDPDNADPSGIALDPTGSTQDLWIVDRLDDRVYRYANARSITSGALTAADSFALAAQNGTPEGIADPSIDIPVASLDRRDVDKGRQSDWRILDAAFETMGQAVATAYSERPTPSRGRVARRIDFA